MAQIQSLVEYGSFIIDKSTFSWTGDKYLFNNHFYSDKPPILALYASPFYFALKQLGLSFEKNLDLTCYLLTLLSIGILSALGLLIFRKILKEFLSVSNEWADVTTFVTGTGTLILPYSLVFNNHVPSGVLILLGFYFFLKFRINSKLENAAHSGFFLSLAGSIDINCFLFIPFMLILFFKKSAKVGLIFGVSCIPAIALYLFLNLYTSGSLIPPAINAPLWNYPGSSFNSENLSGLAKYNKVRDVLFYAFHMLLGNRGLILHTPILLFSILGISIVYKKKLRFRYQAEYGYILMASLLYIFIYIVRTTNYSGWAFGVRWFASLMLILCLPIACLESEIRSSRTIRFLFISVAILSIFISIVGSYNPWTPLVGNPWTPLVGAELEGQLSPTNTFSPVNTIFASIRIIGSDLKNCIFSTVVLMKPPMWQIIFGITQLVLGTFIIYFLLYRFMKNLELIRPSNQDQ